MTFLARPAEMPLAISIGVVLPAMPGRVEPSGRVMVMGFSSTDRASACRRICISCHFARRSSMKLRRGNKTGFQLKRTTRLTYALEGRSSSFLNAIAWCRSVQLILTASAGIDANTFVRHRCQKAKLCRHHHHHHRHTTTIISSSSSSSTRLLVIMSDVPYESAMYG